MTKEYTRKQKHLTHSGFRHTRKSIRHNSQYMRRNNFYLWANQKWLNEVKNTLPRELKYIRPLDNFKIIQDIMYRNVLTMIDDYTHSNTGGHNSSILRREMKSVISSFRDLHPEPILRHISQFCNLYNELVQENNIYKFLGIMNQNEMIRWALPISWSVSPDDYISGKLTANLSGPSLSLYDYRFYLRDKKMNKPFEKMRINISASTVVRQEAKQTQTGGRENIHDNDNDNDDDDDEPETKTIEYIKYKKRITSAFLRFIDNVFTKCLGKDYEDTYNVKAQDVYDIECLMMEHFNYLDPRFDEQYAYIYQSAKHPNKPPHLSENKKKKKEHHLSCCSTGEYEDTTSSTNDRLKLPHYVHNIRGSTRILIRDAMEFTDIDWTEMAKWIGYPPSSIPPYFIAFQVGYLKKIMTTLKKEWASDKWKSYWYFIYMRQLIFFHEKWRNIYLDFNDTLLRGRDTHFPREYIPILGLSYMFPKTMTEEFTRRFKNEEMIAKVREIGNTMLECYKTRIQNNAWMSSFTKKGALKKLNTLRIHIGESYLSAPDPTNLEYDPKDAWGNLLKRSIQRTEYIARHHEHFNARTASTALSPNDIEIMNWGTMKLNGVQSYVVNAYYTSNTNSIYIPTAYMHSMNVQFGRGYEYDLASVGFTFGHEISHALHISSRIYDERGVIKNWWSRDDIATYERKIAAIRRQYEAISKKDGFVIDGNLSLPENLADVTGLSVCEDALNRFHDANAKADPGASDTANAHIRAMSFYNFYTYFAIQNRQYASRREILVQVLTNPHLNLKIRTNVPLMRSKTFREVIEIKKGDKMYNDEFDAVF